MTKVPNLLRNVPRKRIQAARGSAFKLAARFGPAWFIQEIKNPACLSESRVEIVFNCLVGFSLLALSVRLFASSPVRAATANDSEYDRNLSGHHRSIHHDQLHCAD